MDFVATEALWQRQDDNGVVASLAKSAGFDYERVKLAWHIGKAHNRCGPPISSALERRDHLKYRLVDVRQFPDRFFRAHAVKAHLIEAAQDQWSLRPGQNRSETQALASDEPIAVELFGAAITDDQ